MPEAVAPLSPYRETIRYELDRIGAALALAEAATDRLRRVLRPGVPDSIASMMRSDVESAGRRLENLRERARTCEGAL